MGEPYTDEEFPPEFTSLANSKDKEDKIPKFRNKKIEWKRASELKPNCQVFVDGVKPTDIRQGAIGNCYFLASLAALSEFPKLIAARFYTRETNKAGIYLMSFYVNGVEYPVVVDDWMPIVNGDSVFAKTVGGELWVFLMEKAWAKLQGSYARTESGRPFIALPHIIGTPAWFQTHSDGEDALWKEIVKADKRKYTMIASSGG